MYSILMKNSGFAAIYFWRKSLTECLLKYDLDFALRILLVILIEFPKFSSTLATFSKLKLPLKISTQIGRQKSEFSQYKGNQSRTALSQNHRRNIFNKHKLAKHSLGRQEKRKHFSQCRVDNFYRAYSKRRKQLSVDRKKNESEGCFERNTTDLLKKIRCREIRSAKYISDLRSAFTCLWLQRWSTQEKSQITQTDTGKPCCSATFRQH